MAKNKYSSTVLLPKTDFPMRAGLAQRDKEEEEKTRPFAGLADLLKKPN